MLLIRQVGSEEYAKQINNGSFGCRDLLSHLFSKSNGKYKYVDYYEQIFAQIRRCSQPKYWGIGDLSRRNQQLLQFILDPMIADSFMSFFHIFDPELTPRWLEEQNDSCFYFFIEPKCDFGNCVCGENNDCYYVGSPIRYLSSAGEISVKETCSRIIGLPCVFAEREIDGDLSLDRKSSYAWDLLYSYTPLFNRVLGDGTSKLENEFRYVVRTKRVAYSAGISGNLGKYCTLKLNGRRCGIELPTFTGGSIANQVNHFVLHPLDNPQECIDLIAMMRMGCCVEIEMYFYNIDITATSKRWGYIGDKNACRKFIHDEIRGVKRRKETENMHFHKGTWNHLIRRGVHPCRDIAEIISLPEEGAYSSW